MTTIRTLERRLEVLLESGEPGPESVADALGEYDPMVVYLLLRAGTFDAAEERHRWGDGTLLLNLEQAYADGEPEPDTGADGECPEDVAEMLLDAANSGDLWR